MCSTTAPSRWRTLVFPKDGPCCECVSAGIITPTHEASPAPCCLARSGVASTPFPRNRQLRFTVRVLCVAKASTVFIGLGDSRVSMERRHWESRGTSALVWRNDGGVYVHASRVATIDRYGVGDTLGFELNLSCALVSVRLFLNGSMLLEVPVTTFTIDRAVACAHTPSHLAAFELVESGATPQAGAPPQPSQAGKAAAAVTRFTYDVTAYHNTAAQNALIHVTQQWAEAVGHFADRLLHKPMANECVRGHARCWC